MEIIDFLWTCKYGVPQSLTVQSVDSDEPVNEQKLIKNVCKLDKNLKLGLHREALKTNFPNICHKSFKQTRM